jgi:tetratricopeptide (TPR) repeat protein
MMDAAANSVRIPPHLLNEVQNGRVVLVLGAGASLGATHPKGETIPKGSELAVLLANEFLGGAHAKASLSTVADMAVAQVGDARDVFRFIADLLRPFGPGPHHRLLPKFRWQGLVTLNYDEVVEKAYETARSKLNIGISDEFRIEDARSDRNATILLKLHGCITRAEDPRLPLILTPASYADYRTNRHKLFGTLESWAAERTLVFCGTTIDDSDIHLLLRELVKKYMRHPKFYLVEPNADEFVTKRWSSHNIDVITATFGDFLRTLDALSTGLARAIPVPASSVPLLDALGLGTVGVTPEVKRRLLDGVDYVMAAMPSTPIDPKLFYRGFSADWWPIVNNLDCPREIADDLIIKVVLNPRADRPAELVVLQAEAGAGKSVLLRRLAWRIANEHHKVSLWARTGAGLDPTTLEVIAPALRDRMFVFVDDLLQNAAAVVALLKRARSLKAPVTVIGGARSNQWNLHGFTLSQFVEEDAEYEVPRLSHKEIRNLLDLLERHGSLGVLESLSPNDRFDEIVRVADRQLLVALHEATSGKPLQEIIKNEYDELLPEEAQSLYLTVCLLNRTGTPVRAGLIARVHGVTFEAFQERFFTPLDRVVVSAKVREGRDVEYRARHPIIADIVVREVLADPEWLFDRVVRVVQFLNTSYTTDQESFRALTKARVLLEMFPDRHMIDQIYDAAERVAPDDGHLALQRARFEMLRESPSFERAESLLTRSEELLPRSPIVQHARAELEYQAAHKATEPLSRTAALRRADGLLIGLYSKSAGPHAWHTKCKIELLRLRSVLEDRQRSEEDEVRAIQAAEGAVSAALQGFPEDSHLLESEANLADLLDQDERALKALERAARQNLRNANIVARLSRIYRRRNERQKVHDLLRDASAANPAEPKYSFERAMLLMEEDGDGSTIEQLLRRSFSNGDRNHFAQFLHARQVYINGDVPMARVRFRELSAAAGWAPRVLGKPWVWSKCGTPVLLHGRVTRVEQWYGFIEREGTGDGVYVPRGDDGRNPLSDMPLGARVQFNLGFNFRGAFAIEPVAT